jgi:fluoroacetyl-CoA thioesterase
LGEQVTAEATYVGKKGKLYEFEVLASDAAGEVGKGRHERAIVIGAQLEGLAEKRKAGEKREEGSL